ncbi:MAG: endolytic transglycosylase MltG, partial [Pseudomonadota bacterium]
MGISRHLAANGITLLIVGLVVAGGLLEAARSSFSDPGPLAEETVIEVPSGANLSRVSSVLSDAGAISQPLIFRAAARLNGDDERLKRGCYTLPAGASMEVILGLVTDSGSAQACYRATFQINSRGVRVRIEDAQAGAGRETLELAEGVERVTEALSESSAIGLRVAVAEGLTVRDVMTGIAAVPFLEGDLPEAPSEGMLAPDTYEIEPGGTPTDLVARMVAVQERRIAAAWEARNPDVPLENTDALLALASIIEKETGVAEERRTIAGVFVNRLERGMRLQTDPTIIYGITRGGDPMDRPISRADINGVTEQRLHGQVAYNTYQIDGLPPGPIANPG